PLLFYNRALLSGFLADRKNCVAGLRLYARQPIDVDDAIEAEALAQWLDEESHEPNVTDEAIELAIVDEDQLFERLNSHPQAVSLPTHSPVFQNMEGPKPRAYALLLDRPRPGTDEPLTDENLPRVVGSVALYGRQTDRAERLELVCEKGEGCEQATEVLKQVAGDLVGEERERRPYAEFSYNDFASLETLFFGASVSTLQRKPLLDLERRRVLRA